MFCCKKYILQIREEKIVKDHKYQAFISYAHADEAVAARLQNALEKFPVPKALRHNGASRISPIFRDVTELTAHHSLGSKIEDAVQTSRFLIVLCSPAAKNSHWVNEEIKLFRRLHGAESILCALIDGTPTTSFPEALLAGGREPLAANLNTENFQLGTMQLAASILNVGLDDLVQRDAKRRRRRMYAVTAGSLLFSGMMALSTLTAVKARNDAELSRNEAENLVEFMLTDLKEDLQPIGKLDIIDSVGDQVSAYYKALSVSEMDGEHLARRSRSMHILGQVALVQGDSEKSLYILSEAHDITSELLRRTPQNETALYSHAQSEYTLLRYFETRDFDKAKEHGISFKALSKQLYDLDQNNLEYVREYGWAHNKLGQIYQNTKDHNQAEKQFLHAKSIYETGVNKFPDDELIKFRLGTFKRNLGLIQFARGEHKKTLVTLNDSIKELEGLLKNAPNNFEYLDSLYLSKLWVQHIQIVELAVCEPSQIYDLIAGLENLIEHDPSNDAWKAWFVNFSFKSIKRCETYLNADWKTKTIEKTVRFYHTLSETSEDLTEKKEWLENSQAN